jgi:5-aminolevulinate synthase
MSNLQTIAGRCPVMGKALAVQTAKAGKMGFGGAAAMKAIRAFSGKTNSGKARIHTTRPQEARALEDTVFGRDAGRFILFAWTLTHPTIARHHQVSER